MLTQARDIVVDGGDTAATINIEVNPTSSNTINTESKEEDKTTTMIYTNNRQSLAAAA